MKKYTNSKRSNFIIACLVLLIFLPACMQNKIADKPEQKENEMYDGPEKAAEFQFNRTKNPYTGKVPSQQMWDAVLQTKQLKEQYANSPNFVAALSWSERGSYTDIVGPTNGNTRANNGVTSGRIDAILVDKADATGKTVFIGGDMGGIWKTTDITASPATWTLVNDYLGNMIISAIAQDPTNTNIMYFSTGEGFYGGELGLGVFKSTDHGVTWAQLPSTIAYTKTTKLLCDFSGNIYLGTTLNGLLRSTVANGGNAWVDITPSGLSNRIADIEISSTGRLHVTVGISGSTRDYRFTDIPATVSPTVGWTAATTGLPAGTQRAEIAVNGNTLYALPDDAAGQVPTIYKSTNGGVNWSPTTGQPTAGWASKQGWYALAAAINPTDANQCIVGGLDNWKTTDGGATWTAISAWVGTSGQYVHADQHTSIWYDNGNKLLFGCDGGIFYSANGGTTTADRNVGLRLKEFYSCAIHPTLTNYFLAGAQDNGTHQFNGAGLTSSVEVTGGDGAYVAIDQDQPQFQVGAYVFCNLRRTADGGATWSGNGNANMNGQFINPFDYDNLNNKVYAGYDAGQFVRWDDPQSGFTLTPISIAAFAGASVSAVTSSPYTSNRVYFGTNAGKIIKVDNANLASPTAVDISGAGMTGYANAIITGTSDQNLIACFTSYGVTNVWSSTNGGTSWTACDGNLPDIPVYWAVFNPFNNSKAIIATETGVWETDLLNGASTVWVPNATFPTMRTTMLKYRSSDRTLLASAYGRGLWTSTIPNVSTPDIQFATAVSSSTESTSFTSGCRGYTDYTASMQILNPPTGSGSATVTLGTAAGGSAIQGVDYDITTNGNFASPSMQLGFAVGFTTPQNFTIRIYDDAAIEAAETFTLNYTLAAGGTNAQVGLSNQTMTYTIVDNDAAPVLPSGGTQTIGTLSFDLIQTADDPLFNSRLQSKRVQLLYKASELTAAGLTAGPLTAMSFYIGAKNSTRPFTNLTLKMGGTTTADLVNGGYTVITGLTTVKNAFTYSTVLGYNNFTFDAPYTWNGTDNLAIEVCYDNTTAAPSQVSDHTYGYSDGSGASIGNMFWQDNINCSGSFGSVNFFGSGVKPTIKLTVTVTGTPVSTVLNSTKTAYLGPLDDAYFYDGSGNIIARIKNLTAFDYGCTQIIIDRAGTSSTQFWNNTAANYLLSKTCKVIPANITASGSYQITLYYTAAEVAGWEAATGRTWAGSSMQVVKVSNGFFVPDVTPAVPHVADVLLVTGTKGTLGTNFTIRGDFSSTGFSGFGVGVPGNALLAADFQTKASGNFTNSTIWQYNNEGAGFVDALQAPSANNNVNIQAAHTVTLDAGFTINTGKTLTLNGTLNCGTNTITGAGSFVTAAASTLGIGSTAGITASGATGNIQTTTRTFSTTGNYTYNGAANQATGNGLPAGINNLIIFNSGGALNNIVSMGAALTVNGSSTFTSGSLSIGSNTLTLNGTASGSGTLTGTASGGLSTSNLVIGGAALNQTLNFTQTSAATRSLNNFTLNSGSSATLGNALDLYGTIALTTATLNLNAQNLTLKSNTNNTARIANLTGSTLSGATNVTMERWIKVRAGGFGRAYRLLTPTVNTTTSINANWMEGGLNTAIGTNVNPVPLFGTQITGAGGNGSGFDKTQTNQSSFYSTTNAVIPTYAAISNTSSTLDPKKGYFVYVRGDRATDMTIPLALVPTTAASSTTLRATGTILQGTQTTFANPFVGGSALNLITNPYPSPIDWELVRASCTGINAAYTIWDPNQGSRGGFVTWSLASGASSGAATQFIQPGQAFFVQSNGSVPTVNIQESHKTAGNNNNVFIVPPPPPEFFRTELYFTEPNGYRRVADGAIAVFDDTYSAGIDGNDASEINNWDENIAIAKAGKHLAIESRPVIFKTDSIMLFMNNMKQQDYEFEFTPSAFSHSDLKAELVDNFTGNHTLLSLTGSSVVRFTVTGDPASSATNRFKVLFNAVEPPVLSTDNSITISPNPVDNRVIGLRFKNAEPGNYNLRLVNSNGQVLMIKQIYHAGGSAILNIPVNPSINWGRYTLEILKPDNKKLQKALVIL